MGVYESLGVRRVINADATLTRLGGSLMPQEVLEAMQDAARAFVDMHELQLAIGRRIAELTGNEAALVTSGAAAGLYLSAIACGLTVDVTRDLSLHGKQRRRILIQRVHRISYLPSVELSGADVIEIGDELGTSEGEFGAAVDERTLAVLYVAGEHLSGGSIPLEKVIEVAHARSVPVIVDAAAQLPPVDNLWRFTRDLGADLAIFSGGKGLRGPQASGLVLGRADLIDVARAHAAPAPVRGRPMKVGKEEMCGLLIALERYLSLDHAALSVRYEAMVQRVVEVLSSAPGVHAVRDWPSEAGQPIPRAKVTVPGRAAELRQALWRCEPRIAVAQPDDDTLLVNPETLCAGEEEIVAERLLALLQ